MIFGRKSGIDKRGFLGSNRFVMVRTRRRRISIIIACTFLTALFMGPGPVSAFVGGSPDSPNFLFGVPVLYLWAVFWWMVLAGCVIAAARLLWNEED